MKKTSKDLSDVQKQEDVRREKAQSGKIPVSPPGGKSRPPQEEETRKPAEKDSS